MRRGRLANVGALLPQQRTQPQDASPFVAEAADGGLVVFAGRDAVAKHREPALLYSRGVDRKAP